MDNVPGLNATPAASSTPSPMLDPEAAGIYLGGSDKPITVPTLADWRTKRIGPRYIRVGRLIRYRLADLEAWLESRVKGCPASKLGGVK